MSSQGSSKAEDLSQLVRDVVREEGAERWHTFGFEDGGRNEETQNVSSLETLEEAKEQLLSKSVQKGCSLDVSPLKLLAGF